MEKWRTSIKSAYKRRCVLRASFIGGIGVCALVAGGAFLPPLHLALWGFPLFAASIALITWSMLPYRQVTRLENCPDELWINSKGDIVYGRQNTPTFTIPRRSVDKIFYIDRPERYGICITLLEHPLEKVRVHAISFDYKAFQKRSLRYAGCDLFFAFFSERAFRDLQEYLGEDSAPE